MPWKKLKKLKTIIKKTIILIKRAKKKIRKKINP